MTMYDYIKKLIDSPPEDMVGVRHTAAPEHIFRTDGKLSKLLKDIMSDLFHKVTAQALWTGKGGRPDLQLAMAFLLCTRAKAPDEHDYKKLQHHIIYLQTIIFLLPLILKADGK